MLPEEREFEKNDLSSVHYECGNCKGKLLESDKYKMIQGGVWRAEHPEITKHAGFRINELYSPWSSWKGIVENFLEAKKRPETLRVWINTTLGETWTDEESYSISDETLRERIEDYNGVPQGAIILTTGVDVQDDRLECVVKGWGKDDESWFIDRRAFYGSPARPEVWDELDHYLDTLWLHESGVKLRVVACAIDTGGHFTQAVYEYVKPRQRRRIYAVKGMAGGVGKPLVSKPSLGNRLRVLLFTVGVDTAKELIFARLSIDEFGPGYMHFNRKCDEDYFRELTAEKQVTKFSRGFPAKVWVKVRPRNEALDCEVYALAAYTILTPNMEKLDKNLQEKISALTPRPPESKWAPDQGPERPGSPPWTRNPRPARRANYAQAWRDF